MWSLIEEEGLDDQFFIGFFRGIEKKWQKRWEDGKYCEVGGWGMGDVGGKKYYCLEMFPYPSGKLHMGHVRNYTIGDVIAMTKRLEGYRVLHGIGWDAFGLPAENAAIEKGIDSKEWTVENIGQMRDQLRRMGFSYDWGREFATCDENYYGWQQDLFLRLYDAGLVYRKKDWVNWCCGCGTVLANEQVIDGGCWRCGSGVEFRRMLQWFLRIREYAEKLLDYREVKDWPLSVIQMQRNWIGKSEGMEVDFNLEDGRILKVFTTRGDTIYGVTFLGVSVDHEIVEERMGELAGFKELVLEMRGRIQRREVGGRSGIFMDLYARNPYNEELVPIYVADFVLEGYGTGVVMGVPAHDGRDYEFAKANGLEIRTVIQNEQGGESAYTGEGYLVNSDGFSGMRSGEARRKIEEYGEGRNFARGKVNYKLKDWLISRQRGWGNPIPMIHCKECGVVGVRGEDLPVRVGSGMEVECPICGGMGERERDTMDTFVCSSWYFLRFCVGGELEGWEWDRVSMNGWMPVDQYIGGIEHAIMHLLYARFLTKVLNDWKYLEAKEPFLNLLTQGMVVSRSYYSRLRKKYYSHGEAKERMGRGEEFEVKLEKMSKSKKNGVDPDEMIQKYGVDVVRLYILFAAPPEKDLEWDERGLEGAYRFLKRVYRLSEKYQKSGYDFRDLGLEDLDVGGGRGNLVRGIHRMIRKVSSDFIDRYHFNTGIASMMEFMNDLSRHSYEVEEDYRVLRVGLKVLSILLFGVSPHLAEEVNEMVGGERSLYEESWPRYEEDLVEGEERTYVFQVDGKVRVKKSMRRGLTKEELEDEAIAECGRRGYLEGEEVDRVIVARDQLVNIVLRKKRTKGRSRIV